MTTATKINTNLLNQILDLIETSPRKWEQASWVTSSVLTEEQIKDLREGKVDICGTQACVAGWAMLLSQEWEPVIEGVYPSMYVTDMKRKLDGLTPSEVADQEEMDTDQVYIQTGAELLGIDAEQAHYIFIGMEYDALRPKTFTDQVRHYLGLPVKHGTEFDLAPGNKFADVTTYPEDETDAAIEKIYSGAE